ncbi:acetyl-CoA acetyltransferase [Paraburkholderia bannensis]|uniref:Acetyl-CoA acetyltransferase n=1 Tax=Paraburkholderia bannensis TaxID=765414 RepID=A0A7W9TVY4_9BURK|nr:MULTISPECIES: thiolase family protein [Paraburkholderia]MBB3257182.1 acetyl-CoA acetyltransferase [Paraburkholderia sp. WP4_3_2]MBB6102422.1 acetyl-CoA acetyltransferase [Paraburkholderia bannensis]
MSFNDFDGVVIPAAVEVPYSRQPGAGNTGDLLARAFGLLIEKSGLSPRQIDGLGVASFTLGPDHAIDLAWRLGLSPRWCMDDCHGGASGINLLQHAIRAIQHGDANAIALVSGDRFEAADFRQLVEHYNLTTRTWLRPLQNGGPNSVFAMLTQRHARCHGLTRSDYGAVCIAQRAWATQNPQAVYRTPMSLADYLEAPPVADPLGRFDCVPVVSGANAILLTRADLAAGVPTVRVRALQCLYNADHQEGDGLTTPLASISGELWRQAGFGAADVDVVSVYDDYPVMTLVQLCDLGFAPDGDLRALISRLGTRALAVNTSGGQLSAGQAGAAGGMHGLVEAITQLRGAAGERQVKSATRAVVSGYGMVEYRFGMCANAVVLERT